MDPLKVVCCLGGEFKGWEIGKILGWRGGMKYLRAMKQEMDITPPRDGHRKEFHEALLDIAEMLVD